MYMWTIQTGGGEGYSRLWKLRGGGLGPGNVPLDANDGTLATLGEWIELKVVVEGDTIKCYLDGKEEKNVVDDGSIHGDVMPSGCVALRATSAVAYFDDVKITGPFLAVEPDMKLAISWGSIKLGD